MGHRENLQRMNKAARWLMSWLWMCCDQRQDRQQLPLEDQACALTALMRLFCPPVVSDHAVPRVDAHTLCCSSWLNHGVMQDNGVIPGRTVYLRNVVFGGVLFLALTCIGGNMVFRVIKCIREGRVWCELSLRD